MDIPSITPRLANFIVCEKTPYWALAFRHWLRSQSIHLVETRSFANLREELKTDANYVVALELRGENAEKLFGELNHLRIRYPKVASMVVSSRGFRSLEWLFREAGAMYFLDSPRELAGAMRGVRRHLELS